MGSDGLKWAQIGSDGLSGNDGGEDWRRQRLMIGRSVTLNHWGWIKMKVKHGCLLKMEERQGRKEDLSSQSHSSGSFIACEAQNLVFRRIRVEFPLHTVIFGTPSS